MSSGNSSLQRSFLGAMVLLSFACTESPESTSAAAQTQLYHRVLSAALEHSEVENAVPQIQLRTVRVTPEGVPFPGDRPDHYSREDSPALRTAVEGLAGVILREGPDDVDTEPPAEIFVFSNPDFAGDSAATVGIRAARLGASGYWGDAWEARLRWENGEWIMSQWLRTLHEGH